MKDHRFNKAIGELKKIRMTDTEKKTMLMKIMAAPLMAGSVEPSAQEKPVKSPWTVYSFRLWVERHQWSYVAAVLFIFIMASTGVAFAAQSALPGDVLYPVKVSVTEPIRVAMATTPEAKAQVEASIATTRLEEAETLAAQGKLDASKQNQIQASLDAYSAKFNSSIAGSLSSHLEELKMDFHAALDAHARVLDLIASVEASTTDKTVVSNIANVARKNATAFGLRGGASNAGNGSTNSASSTVPREKQKGNGRSGDFMDMNGYGHHRQSVQSLIESTQSDLKGMPTSTDQRWNQLVASGTADVLNQAGQSLGTADQESMNGQATSANHTLLQSEKSATEANIFLHTGLKFSQSFGGGNLSKDHGNNDSGK